jgi:iron(III) transport system ATP-binding protein
MLRVEKITKSYDKVEAVKGITLHVAPGEVLAILGPSGSGKTSLLRLIAGFERPDAGIVSIEGVDVSSPMKMIAPSKRNLSMIFQDLALWPHMTVKQHIEFVLKKDKLGKNVLHSEIITILDHVRLNGHHSRYPHELSGGEKLKWTQSQGQFFPKLRCASFCFLTIKCQLLCPVFPCHFPNFFPPVFKMINN